MMHSQHSSWRTPKCEEISRIFEYTYVNPFRRGSAFRSGIGLGYHKTRSAPRQPVTGGRPGRGTGDAAAEAAGLRSVTGSSSRSDSRPGPRPCQCFGRRLRVRVGPGPGLPLQQRPPRLLKSWSGSGSRLAGEFAGVSTRRRSPWHVCVATFKGSAKNFTVSP